MNDRSEAVVEEIRHDAPEVESRPRGRGENAKPPRPRYQRAFVQWFDGARDRFQIPVRILCVRRDHVRFEVSGFGGCLRGSVRRDGFSVAVDWRGECIDLAWDMDVQVKRSAAGYYCGCCLPEFVEFYPTREALWIGHSFEPFLEWMNDVPAKAEVLRLSIGTWGSCAEFLSADGRRVCRAS